MTSTAPQPSLLTPRWEPLREHAEQLRLVHSRARFKVVAAGRRSGKTERAKRKLVRACLNPPQVESPRFIAAAPTRDQAKMIFWEDLKLLTPDWALADDPSETELTIRFVTGARLVVVGMDKPHRAEGQPIDGGVGDEMAEWKPSGWSQSLRPTLSTPGRPPGWFWFTGRPKGRGLFYELYQKGGVEEGWESFHWTSDTVVDAAEIEQARRDLDPLTFAQEYEAQWVVFQGLAYYQWSPPDHYRDVVYDPALDLVFCFDFNVEPGVAAVLQEQTVDGVRKTCCIGEVHIPRNSNTLAVCRKLCKDWGHHKGSVLVYGDPSGGARHTSSENQKTDWDLVRDMLRPTFGDRVKWRVARRAPYVRDRVNAMNSRLKSTAGDVRFAVNPKLAPFAVKDFEGVQLLEGGSGEIDKKGAERAGLSHLSEAIGYYVHQQYPISSTGLVSW